ncbi:MAG: hypothetical protein WA137_03445, partial [Methanothrix sp.]
MALPPTSPPTSKLQHSILREEPDARLKQLLHELQPLREMKSQLLERFKILEDQEEHNHGPIFSEENSPTNDDALADALSELPAMMVAYFLFCKMILRPYIQYVFGKKEDTEPWRYLNCWKIILSIK